MYLVRVTAPTIEPLTLAEIQLHLRVDPDETAEDEYLEALITTAREHVENITRRALLSQVWDYAIPSWPRGDAIKLPLGNLQSVLSLTIADSACVEGDGTYDLIFTGDCTTAATGTYTIATNVITAVALTDGGTGYLTAPTVATQTGDGGVTAALARVTWKDTDGTATTLTAGTDYLIETDGNQCGRIVLPYSGTWPNGTLYPSNPITIRFLCGWTTADLVPANLKAAIKMIATDLYENREAQLVASMTQAYSGNKTVNALLWPSRLWDDL